MPWHAPSSRVAVTCCHHTFSILPPPKKKKRRSLLILIPFFFFSSSSSLRSIQLKSLLTGACYIQLLRKGPAPGVVTGLRRCAFKKIKYNKRETVTWVKVFIGIGIWLFLFFVIYCDLLRVKSAGFSFCCWVIGAGAEFPLEFYCRSLHKQLLVYKIKIMTHA